MFNATVSEQYCFVNRTCVYRNNEPINRIQENILNTLRKKTYGNSVEQAIDFAKDHPVVVAKSLIPNKNDDGMNFLIMSSGLTIPITISVSVPGGQPVAIALASLGVGIWYGKSVYEKIQIIRQSGFYRAWKQLWIHTKKTQLVYQYILSDNQLKYFICPITQTLPIMPIKFAGSDEVYDGDPLIDWINHNPNAVHPYFNKVLKLEDVVIDFAHLYSIVDRLENLHRKTLAYIDQEAYQYNSAIDHFFQTHGTVQLNEVRKIIADYLDFSSITRINEFEQFETRRLRESHPVLCKLTCLFKVFEKCINSQKNHLKRQYKEECLLSPAHPTVKMIIISECWKNMHQRKIVWFKGEKQPVYNKKSSSKLELTAHIFNGIVYAPIYWPLFAFYTQVYNKKVLHTIDLTKPISQDVLEYTNTQSLS